VVQSDNSQSTDENMELENCIHCILVDAPVFGFVLSAIISAPEHIPCLLYMLATQISWRLQGRNR